MENCCHLLLEVLNTVKYSHKKKIAKLQIILISNCQNYQMASTVIMFITEDLSNKMLLQFWQK